MISIPVSITSDFICPWCYIGERGIARAAETLTRELGEEVRLDIAWRPFELNPDLPTEGIERRAYRIAKFGRWEYSQQLDAHVVEAGKSSGVVFNYDRITRTPNTRRAHRLVWWASRDGRDAGRLPERLFEAYFVEARDIALPSVLADIAADAGFDQEAVTAFLATDEGTAEIITAEMDEAHRGVRGVPDFAVASIGFSGAQPVDKMVAALRRAAQSSVSKS
jgi:predicted DsbA family dithiol-disulfide isomerase